MTLLIICWWSAFVNMTYPNSLGIVCFTWPTTFAHTWVCLVFITIWVHSWECVSYECHSSSVEAEAKLKTSARGCFVYCVWLTLSHKLMTPEFLSSPTILSLELQTHLLSHPLGIFMWTSFRLPKHVASETELIFHPSLPTQRLFSSVLYIFINCTIIHPVR